MSEIYTEAIETQTYAIQFSDILLILLIVLSLMIVTKIFLKFVFRSIYPDNTLKS
jgi:hypothetical protein